MLLITLVQAFDIIIHIALNQIEPIRLVAIGVLFISLISTRLLASTRAIQVLALSGGIYLILNGIFVLENGLTNGISGEPRVMLIVIVLATAVLGVLYGRFLKTKENQNEKPHTEIH